MSERITKIQAILDELRKINPDVEACSLISADGLPIASIMPLGADEIKIAAMAAAIESVAERVTSELQRGDLKQVYIEGTDGGVIVVNTGKDTALVVVIRPKAKLGLILLDVRETIKKLLKLEFFSAAT
ncbi:MAG: hypothetical protein DRJ32_05375 [Thermoprotei archaeon]|nr:MAG: hypothetical protein B6U94_03275 [Thermofilum sp. ex4484_79]RLE59016.1 MAG: hypothetical protein DRJ32_05375 [Thermoprotei archaeon]HDD63679.1 hypothetical protein [Thermoprotei archaeon]